MSKKNVLKSIAAAGVAFGGASVLQDGELVYAAELETTEMLGNEEELVIELELPSDSPVEGENQMQTSELASAESASETSEVAMDQEFASAEESESLSTSESVSVSTYENVAASETSVDVCQPGLVQS